MNELKITGIECFAYHGCLDEEALIGCHYKVDVVFYADFKNAIASDNLADAVDYVAVNQIVRNEMAVRSKLIEHVAGRILLTLRTAFSGCEKITVSVHKLFPPVNGLINAAAITISG